MFLSDLLKGGQTLQGQAGSLAINANDLLETNQFGQLFTVKCSDNAAVGNAGGTPVPKTTVSSFTGGASLNKESFRNSADGSIFMTAPYLSSNEGLELYKFNSAGALLGSIILDAATASPNDVTVQQLTSSNLVVVWQEGGSAYFAIVGTGLNVIVAKTAITSGAPSAISLSGGGFSIVTISGGAAPQIAIYSNTGASVLAPTTVAGAATNAVQSIPSQLSNGNIVVVCTYGASLGQIIYTAAGTVVAAYTTFNTTVANPSSASISTLDGVYCFAVCNQAGGDLIYIFNNSGTQEGTTFNSSTFGGIPTGYFNCAAVNDGTNFWVCFGNALGGAGGNGAVIYAPTTGSGYVASLLPQAAGTSNFVAMYELGFLIIYGSSGPVLYVCQLTSSGQALLVGTVSLTLTSGDTASVISAGDFSVLLGQGVTSAFAVVKYLNTAIVGVAQQAVAAGNAGTLLTYSHGGGAGKNGYLCNPIIGTVGKGFNHSATNIVGNTGTMLGNSVALEGII